MNLKDLLEPHAGTIYLLTVVLSLTFGVVILTLRRNAIILQEKKWAMPFAITFFTLAGIYSLLLLDLNINSSWPKLAIFINAVTNLCSGVTNYLLLLSAFRLAEPILDKRRLRAFKNSKLGRAVTWPALLLLLCSAGLLMSAEPWWGPWVKAPDAVFSAIALYLMGYVLYNSISYRHDEFMAKMAFLASLCYAVLYLFYGLMIIEQLVLLSGSNAQEAESAAGLITSLVSLVLKFGIFLPAYSLMLLVSGPLEGVDRLLDGVTRKNKEYLGSDGVAKAIRNELRVNSVRLYIKRPGPDDERVVLCAYPSLPPMDDNNQEPLEVRYEKGSHYDRVLKTGEPYIEAPQNRFIRRISEVAVPVCFHTAVIAVLYVERGERNFTEADLINLKRIATMVSPAVQAYREMDTLKQIGHELTQLQIRVKEYDMQRDVGDITRRVHETISPLATGVSIEIGFVEYKGIYPPDEGLEELVGQRLKAELGEEDEADQEGNRWFTMDLKISDGHEKDEKAGGQVFGKFIFVPESEKIKNGRVTVGTSPTFRRVLSDALTETLLNFIRGRLNRLTDKLGSRLSGLKGTDTESWRKEVEHTAREARLLWVVARDPDRNNLLGGSEMVELVEWLESPERREQWGLKAENLWLYSVEEPRLGTYRVIKKYLKESGAILWFGVERQNFGRELDYVSPWRYFLDHFCEIADSALGRVQMMKREKKQIDNMLLLYSTIGGSDDATVDFHDISKHAQSLRTPLESLLEAARNDGLQLSTTLRKQIYLLEAARSRLKQEVNRLQDIGRRNKSRSCSLNQAITDACEELKDDLKEHNIDLDVQVPTAALIGVPHGIARLVLKTILVNATEALQDYPCAEGRKIQIKVGPPTGGKFNCDISDNGPGVSDDVWQTILKEVSVSTKNGSQGVGLLYSRIAMIKLGGDIINLGQKGQRGASFRIEFPRAESSPGDKAEPGEGIVQSGAESSRLRS